MLGNARDDDRHLKQIYDDSKKDHDSDHIPLEGNLSFRKTSRGEIEDRSAQRKPIKSFDQSKLVVNRSRMYTKFYIQDKNTTFLVLCLI